MLGRRHSSPKQQRDHRRSGTVLVETAVIAPVFFLFLIAIVEFGHAFMVINTLNSAAKQAARQGALENSTNASITNLVDRILGASYDNAQVTVMIKDGSVFDTPGFTGEGTDYEALPTFNAANAETGDLFIVRLTVPYAQVSIFPPLWTGNITLRGQSVARHE